MKVIGRAAFGLLCVLLLGCAGRSFSRAYERVAEIEIRAYRMQPNSQEAREWNRNWEVAMRQLELETAQLDLSMSSRKRLLDTLIEENGLILGSQRFERLYEETYRNHEMDRMKHKWLPFRAVAKNRKTKTGEED